MTKILKLCFVIILSITFMIGTIAPASASSSFIGQSSTNQVDGVHAILRAPDWYPSISHIGFPPLYSWVMMSGVYAPGCRFWVQVGWIADNYNTTTTYAAEQAWVEPGCPGGWTTYHTYQNFDFGSDHRFEILNSGGDWWQVTIDNQIVDEVNLPTFGPTAQAQIYVEGNGVNAMPDITSYNIDTHSEGVWSNPSCAYRADAPFSFIAQRPCDYFVARR